MGKKRMFDTRFWSDVFIVDNLNPLEKLLYLYLLLNERSNLIGIYELSVRTAAFETGIDRDTLEKMLTRLSPKVEYIDGFVYIRRYADHQMANPNIATGMEREVAALPAALRDKIIKNGIVSERLAKAFNEYAKPLEGLQSVRDTRLNLTRPNGISPTDLSTAKALNRDKQLKNDVQEVFDFYVKSFGAENSHIRLSDLRKSKIKARLEDAGKDMLFKAITQVANDPFYRGDNDRGWKANIDFIIRNYEQVEKFATADGETETVASFNRKPTPDELKRALEKF